MNNTALDQIRAVANEIKLAAYASAGDPTRRYDMKMFASWAGRLDVAP